ncbi:hypothetical protein BH09SUM1_BH09SUM1_06970 [soil metagenome]
MMDTASRVCVVEISETARQPRCQARRISNATSLLLAMALMLFTGLYSSAAAVVCENGSETELTGAFSNLNIEQHSFSVGVVGLVLGQTAEVIGLNGQPATLANFHQGDQVTVKYCPATPGPPTARYLKKLSEGTPPPTATPPPTTPPPTCNLVREGVITVINAGEKTLRVQDTVIKVVLETEIRSGETVLLFTDLHIGDRVEVHGCPLAGATPGIVASRIDLEDARHDGEFEEVHFAGQINSVNGDNNTFVLNGLLIATDNTTEYTDHEGQPKAFSDLAAGQAVEVVALRPVPGPSASPVAVPPVAKKVKINGTPTTVPPPNSEFHIRGYLQSIGEHGNLIVGGRPIATDEETVYLDRQSSTTLTLAGLHAGDFLQVDGIRTQTETLLARTVRLQDPVGVDFHIQGPITAIVGVVITINNDPIGTTDDTVFLDAANNVIARDQFVVGNQVAADGIRTAEGNRVARTVRKIGATPEPSCDDNNTDFSGKVTEASNTETARFINVAGRHVLVNSATRITDAENRAITLAQIAVNMNVRVQGRTGLLNHPVIDVTACRIQVLGDNTGGIPVVNRILGVADAVDTATMTFKVRDVTITTNNETEFSKRRDDHQPTTLADLHNGDNVEVLGNRLGDGTFLARLVRIQEERVTQPNPARIIGLVSALNRPGGFTVNDQPVNIDGPVQVHGFEGINITLGDIAVGDFVTVEGLRSSNTAPIVARDIFVRAAVIAAIDTTSNTMTISGYTVLTNGDTHIVETTTTLAFSDLSIGNLVRVGGQRVGPHTILAHTIRRFADVSFSGPVGEFEPTHGEDDHGHPIIESHDNHNTFGFVDLPLNAFRIEPNAIFDIKAHVTSNVAAAVAPGLRIRTNNRSFLKASELVAESEQDARYSPTAAGFQYHGYFVPAVAPSTGTNVDGWYASMDMINVNGANAANARFRLDSLEAAPISLDRISVAATLLDNSFDTDTEGWHFGGAAPVYTLPAVGGGGTGTLDLAATDTHTFGFWTKDTGVAVEGNTLYRGRFLVRASSADQSKVPTFRVRLNLKSYMLASLIVITSNGAGEESPDATGRLYDVYLYIPGSVISGETVLASFDLIGTASGDDLNSAVSLDQFTFEKLAIAP